jgi:Uma2 family endonuclease
MNEFTKFPPSGPKTWPTTQAAEGVPRLRWTMEDFDRLTELGVFGDKDHIELIGGELVPMAAKGNRHERVRQEIHDWLIRRLPKSVSESVELGWRPMPGMYLEPDLMLFPRAVKAPAFAGAEALLVIEIARSSLARDLNFRARTMAALGVLDFWVVNADSLATTVHREPAAKGYASKVVVPAKELLTPLRVPELALRLGDLDIDG